MYQLKIDRCSWCDAPIVQKAGERQVRSDKKFCCASHRMAFNRWLKNIQKRERQATKAIESLGMYLQHGRSQATACDALNGLVKHIHEIARQNNVRVVR